jgi:hypothetical protein
MVADWRTRGLDHIDVIAAQVIPERAQFAVREPFQLARHRLGAQRPRDGTSQ